MKVTVLGEGLTVDNAVLDIGAVVDLEAADVQRLVEYGLVEPVEEPEETTEEVTEEPEEPKKTTTRGKK